MSVNKVILVGNLGTNPELRTTTSGESVCQLRMATNERWVDSSGRTQTSTEWHRVVVWGARARSCAQYLSTGRQIYVEGKIQTRQWEDKEGNKRFTTEVVASDVRFLQDGRKNQKVSDNPPLPDEPLFDFEVDVSAI